MVTSLPSRIMNYSVSSSSPTDELLTLGQIFSEVGDYASTILDREHLSLSRRCVARLNKVVEELVSRKSIRSAENLYDMPEADSTSYDLKSLSIDDLHKEYRRWPIRHNERRAKGRESWTFYYERDIVNELKNRKTANKGEQFKIDYCTTMYSNELSNMSDLFSRPVQIDDDKIYPENGRVYNYDELLALITLYKDYRDVLEREILIQYVDKALDFLEKENDLTTWIDLLAELVEIRRKEIIRIPKWVSEKLEEAILRISSIEEEQDFQVAPALLTLHIINNDLVLECTAQRLINRCYKSAFDSGLTLSKRIENLHTAVTCCDYVSRFSVRKVAVLWNELSDLVLSSNIKPTPRQLFLLLEIAKECEGYANISAELKDSLIQKLDNMAATDCPEAQAYSKIVKLRF